MERIDTELAWRDRDGTGDWNGLALNWDGETVIAPENGTDVNPSSDLRRYMRPDGRTNIKNVTGTSMRTRIKMSIKETVRENVNVNHLLVKCREGPVVFRRAFAPSTYNPHFAMLPRLHQLPKRYWN
jgi:hypothetical protein